MEKAELIDGHTRRVVGRRKSPELSLTPSWPTPEEEEWMRRMNDYKLRFPKGVFRYRSHEEANRDTERWLVETMIAGDD